MQERGRRIFEHEVGDGVKLDVMLAETRKLLDSSTPVTVVRVASGVEGLLVL